MASLPVTEGETLEEGTYRIGALLGQGGMGCVFHGTHVHLEHPVAIKFLTRAGDSEAELRFVREARIAASLKSKHVVRVNNVGRHKGTPYIVMEYLEGEDLTALLERAGPLPVDRAVTYVLQACEALAEAHAAGVVHRDVKPSNLMLVKGAAGPLLKVLDFGISKAAGPLGVGGTEQERLTATAQMLGSPLYMAPEQINDAAHVDGRADVWSLGVVLYQLLTCATPWVGNGALALFSSMASHPPTPIGEYRSGVPAGLSSIVEQCLQKDRSLRWSSIATFAAALAPYGPASAAEIVAGIAACQDLPAVQAARPTEPMPAPGEASTFGWVAPESAPDPPERRPLASRPDVAPILGAAPVAVPARTSVSGTGTDARTGSVGGAWPVRKIAMGVAAGAALLAAIVAWRAALREPPLVAGPVALPTRAEEPRPSSTPEPRVEPTAPAAPVTAAAAPAVPSAAPLAPAPSSPATARPKTATHSAPAQPPAAPPAARPTELPGGSRQ